MLKLGDSLPDAKKLAKKHPDHYKVGNTGWLTATLPYTESPRPSLFERWIDESFRLIAPQTLIATLIDSPAKPSRKRKRTT